MPTFSHPAAASRQHSGGSSSETNSPPVPPSSACVEANVRSTTASRSAAAAQRLDGPVLHPLARLAGLAVADVQEAHDRLTRRGRVAVDQALRLVGPGVAAALRPAVRLGVQAAERPALPVLDRRPVRV